uniref:DUF5577 domain-containing protein n=1 Tax=Fundulus heteroclitus TaxID=8078 RepID=A0A3Q2SXP9_FUNHE
IYTTNDEVSCGLSYRYRAKEAQQLPLLSAATLSVPLPYIRHFRFSHVCVPFCLHGHFRIQKNMLMDLSKDIMMDLGITVIGDIIAILKHAKQVYRQVSPDRCTENSGKIETHCNIHLIIEK